MSLSVCIIGKDEEAVVERCLSSAKRVADQIVFVDTGSTDRTREIAARYADVLADYRWNDDFAAARNHSIMHASKNWILWLDCDDEITDEAAAQINKLKADPPDCAFCFSVKNVDAAMETEAIEFDEFLQLRMFPRKPEFVFRGRIHEQVAQSVYDAGCRMFNMTKVVVLHHGYKTEEEIKRKLSRNRRLTLITNGTLSDAEYIEWEQDGYTMLYTPFVLTSWRLGKMLSIRTVYPIEVLGISTAHSFARLKEIAKDLVIESRGQERFTVLEKMDEFGLDAEVADINKRVERLLENQAAEMNAVGVS